MVTHMNTLSFQKPLYKLVYGAVLVLLASVASAQSQDDPRWVTSWATSPSTLPGATPVLEDGDNRTLRLVVHSSAPGEALRLRLSNYHGEIPVEIGAVSIALQDSGARFQADSLRPVLFHGEESVTIAKGATVISDPLAFDVPAMTNLSVSLYVIEDGDFATGHALANQTSYVSSAGDFALSQDLGPAMSETPAWPYLTAIDVINNDNVSAIATVGDSITDGWGSTTSANQRWPDHFIRRLYADNSITDFAVVNAGISGNRVTTEQNPTFGENLQARFERDVLALSKVTHMVLLEGINDIGMAARTGEPIEAEAIIAGYRNIIARAHARGIKVIGATLTPYEDAAYFTPEGEITRQRVNDFIRNSDEFDGVIDFDAAIQDPQNPTHLPANFTADNLHPNDAGYKVMAESIDLDLFR